jgi:hypothetical protein
MKKRFYDQDPSVSQAIELLLIFPEEMQAVIADGLSTIAEQEFRANEMINDFKSMGSDKVLALYKSKQKKRKYDKNPTVHRAMNYMMILSPENRVIISKKILEMITFLQGYLITCKNLTTAPSLNGVERIRDVYVQFGPDDVRHFLAAMQEEFMNKLQGLEITAKHPAAGDEQKEMVIITEEITVEGPGMKIKGDFR